MSRVRNRSDLDCRPSLLCSHAAFTPSSSSQHLKIQTRWSRSINAAHRSRKAAPARPGPPDPSVQRLPGLYRHFNHVGLFPFNIWGYNHFTNNIGRFIGYAFGFTFLFVNFMSYVVVYNLL